MAKKQPVAVQVVYRRLTPEEEARAMEALRLFISSRVAHVMRDGVTGPVADRSEPANEVAPPSTTEMSKNTPPQNVP